MTYSFNTFNNRIINRNYYPQTGYQNLNKTSIYDDGSVVIEVLIRVSKSATAASKYVVLSVDTGMNGIDFTANVVFNVGPSVTYTYNSVRCAIRF